MGLVHCAATNNHVDVINFVFESLEADNVNAVEKVDYCLVLIYFILLSPAFLFSRVLS